MIMGGTGGRIIERFVTRISGGTLVIMIGGRVGGIRGIGKGGKLFVGRGSRGGRATICQRVGPAGVEPSLVPMIFTLVVPGGTLMVRSRFDPVSAPVATIDAGSFVFTNATN